MYKGIAGSEGIGIGKVVLIEEHDLTVEKKSVTDTDAELKRLQDAIEKFVSIRTDFSIDDKREDFSRNGIRTGT